MKKICQLQPGDIFTWMDARFVVLEHQDDGTAVLTEGKIGNSPFQSEDTEHPCDYSASTAKKKIDSFAAKLADDCGIEGALIPFEVDLRPTDMSDTGYGEITVLAAPLTLWQYGKYKHLIPLLDDWWWLATPMWAPWSSPYCDSSGGATYALRVYSNGSWYYDNCSSSYALRPALKLNSNLSVSVDGDGENCGECDFDLGRINSADLLNELKRRLEDSCANSIL
jgi:hypothetical protein